MSHSNTPVRELRGKCMTEIGEKVLGKLYSILGVVIVCGVVHLVGLTMGMDVYGEFDEYLNAPLEWEGWHFAIILFMLGLIYGEVSE